MTNLFEHLPSGIQPKDNDAGTRSSLEKLARFTEQQGVDPIKTEARN